MGQKRITVVDSSQKEEQQKVSPKRVSKKVGKTAEVIKSGKGGTGRLVDKGESIEEIILPEEEKKEEKLEKKIKETPEDKTLKKPPKQRSRRYKYARSQVDKTITYPLDKAIDLVKKTTIARFDTSISAHLNLNQNSIFKDVAFPHSTGKKIKVAIATDATIKKIQNKKIDFDILLATPDMMPKISKLAKILGPMGLMPNPKNNTITNDPVKRKKELESGTTQVKTESKAPLIHVVIGKTSTKDAQLIANLKVLVQTIGESKIKKLTLASTMSPGIKVDIENL